MSNSWDVDCYPEPYEDPDVVPEPRPMGLVDRYMVEISFSYFTFWIFLGLTSAILYACGCYS